MVRLYNTISPIYLLLSGWLFIFLAFGIRILSGDTIPWLNLIFIPAGLMVYFLPDKLVELNQGEALRRKLLWVLVLAGFMLVVGESYKSMTSGG